jgi:hypothetical protein
MQFKKVHSKRAVLDGDATTEVDSGASPITRWLAYAFDYADRVSNSGETAWIINCLVPRGSLIMDAMVRLDQAFDGTAANSVEIGDANQASGYAAAIDLTQDPGTTPIWIRDANAVYVDTTNDISAGSTGAQYYKEGGVVIVVLSTTVPTQGRALLFLETPSYNEPQNSEWT